MLNVKIIGDRMKELDAKHHDFFKAANASTLSFIELHDSGKITFKTGIILDRKIWQEIKERLE